MGGMTVGEDGRFAMDPAAANNAFDVPSAARVQPAGVLAKHSSQPTTHARAVPLRRQKNQTLNPLSISLDPFISDPKKNQNPDTKGSFEC